MASGTILRRGLVKENGLCRDYFRKFVTFRAAHILVCAAQRETGALLVIEERWLPLHAVVTLRARRNPCLGELLAVNVLVAVLTTRGRSLEIHIQ